jgi:hypothetical protein
MHKMRSLKILGIPWNNLFNINRWQVNVLIHYNIKYHEHPNVKLQIIITCQYHFSVAKYWLIVKQCQNVQFPSLFKYVFNGGRESYSDGAYRNILSVPHTQAVVKIYKNKRSITMAIYFQSRASWKDNIKNKRLFYPCSHGENNHQKSLFIRCCLIFIYQLKI